MGFGCGRRDVEFVVENGVTEKRWKLEVILIMMGGSEVAAVRRASVRAVSARMIGWENGV